MILSTIQIVGFFGFIPKAVTAITNCFSVPCSEITKEALEKPPRVH